MQGEFTKEEIIEVGKSFEEIYLALSKNKQRVLLGNANDIYLFLSAASKIAPPECVVDFKT
mgnify:CR=1 FL=1